MAAELVSKKIEYVFNKITLSLIKEVKDKDSGIKRKIKTNYGVFDKYSENHIVRFINEMDTLDGTGDLLKMPYRDADILKTESPVLKLSILQDVTVLDLLSIVDEREKEIIKSYLYILYMFSYLYNEVTMCISTKEQDDSKADSETEKNDECNKDKVKAIEMMLSKSMKLIQDTETFDMNKDADEILDDDLKVLLDNIYHTKTLKKNPSLDYTTIIYNFIIKHHLSNYITSFITILYIIIFHFEYIILFHFFNIIINKTTPPKIIKF